MSRSNTSGGPRITLFTGIAAVMFMEVLGIFYNHVLFWIISLILYGLAMIVLSSVLYHPGRWSLNHITIIALIKVVSSSNLYLYNYFNIHVCPSFLIVLSYYSVCPVTLPIAAVVPQNGTNKRVKNMYIF